MIWGGSGTGKALQEILCPSSQPRQNSNRRDVWRIPEWLSYKAIKNAHLLLPCAPKV